MANPEIRFPKIVGADLSPDRIMRAPLGAISPLWFAFGAAASAGVTYWWMTRWMRPTHLEAFLNAPVEATVDTVEEVVEAQATVIQTIAETVVEVPEVAAEAMADIAADAGDALDDAVEPVMDAAQPSAEAVADTTEPMVEAIAESASKPTHVLDAATDQPAATPAPKAKAAPRAKPSNAKAEVVTVPTARAPRRNPRQAARKEK